MRTIHRLAGSKIELHAALSINGVEYGAGALRGWTEQELASVGIETAQVEDYPDSRGYTCIEAADGTPTITARPLADVIADLCAEVDALAAQKRTSVIGTVSPYEAASWSIKRGEALAYVASSNVSDAPSLNAEATARGITLAALAAKVLGKAAALSALEAGIAGANGKHNDAIKALMEQTTPAPATVDDVLAYDYTTGWPV